MPNCPLVVIYEMQMLLLPCTSWNICNKKESQFSILTPKTIMVKESVLGMVPETLNINNVMLICISDVPPLLDWHQCNLQPHGDQTEDGP